MACPSFQFAHPCIPSLHVCVLFCFVFTRIPSFITKTYFELDPTELYKDIKYSKREAIVKIICYIALFGFYLFSFIKAVIAFESSSRA